MGVAGAVAVVGAGTFFAVRAVTQEENAGRVDGMAISAANLASAQTVTARVQLHDLGYKLDLASIARRDIDFREAQRRGFTCTSAEAQRALDSSVATAEQHDVNGLLQIIEDSGGAPIGYDLTPEAQRTPGTTSVIEAYRHDADVLATMQRFCAVGKLMQSVEDAAKPPAGTPVSGQPPNVVATFRAGLYASATVVDAAGKPIDVRYATPVPQP